MTCSERAVWPIPFPVPAYDPETSVHHPLGYAHKGAAELVLPYWLQGGCCGTTKVHRVSGRL